METKTHNRYTKQQEREMKEAIRTGAPIITIAESLSEKWNRSLASVACKLYTLSRRTYKIADWNGPKRRRKKNTAAPITTNNNNTTTTNNSRKEASPLEITGKKVVMFEDHVRIYF